VDAAILAAAVELLAERGFDLTFDEVAARAGVGRTSVFRRYATKQDLVLAAAEQVTIERIEVPGSGSLRGDLRAAVTRIYAVFGRADTQALARHALTAAYQSAEGGVILRAVLGRRLELVTEVLERAAARGEIPDSDRAPLVADLLSGVIMARLATGVPLPEGEEADHLAEALATAAGGRPGG
jgi:AcrR family transcriptional regulator